MSTHVYFDLDGTLTDPFDGITRCILYALDKLGFPHPDDDYLFSCIGPPLWDTFPEMVGPELTRQAVDLYRERFTEVGWLENRPYDGILETLAAIRDAGHEIFVATSKPHEAARRIVKHFGMAPYIREVYGSELDGTRSDKRELLAYALARNPGASRNIMIGDRRHDLVGAIANAMEPIGVAYGYGSIEELTGAGATKIARSPADIPPLIS